MRALASTSRRHRRCRPARVVVATPSAPSRRGRAGDDRALSRSSARAVTRARRRVASAPTPRRPRRPVAASTRGHVTGDRGFHIYARASHCAWDSERPEYASWTTRTPPKPRSARSPRPRVGRRARAAARRDRVVTSRIDEANGARDGERRDATRANARGRARGRRRWRARETARGAPRRGSGRDDAGRGLSRYPTWAIERDDRDARWRRARRRGGRDARE